MQLVTCGGHVGKTRSDILAIFNDMDSYYRNTHRKMLRADRMVEQEFEGLIDVPYEVRVFLSSTAANIVGGFRNQIKTSEPTVDFQPFGVSREAVKHGGLMQRWGRAMMRRERERSVIDPDLQCGFDLLLRGAACKKIVVDVDNMLEPAPKGRRSEMAYRDWERLALRNWPFVTRAIDPLAVFPAPGQIKPIPFMIEKQTRHAGEMWRQYPGWVDPHKNKRNGRNPARTVEWLEYWDEDEYIVLADGEMAFEPRANPYGFIPYIFEWSGYGRSHKDGDPAHLAVGVITEILGELEAEVRLKTAIDVQTQMHVFPPILTVEDPKKVARQFGVGPGKVIRHPPGHPPEYMKYPPPNENMYRFLDAIQQNIVRVASPALSGGRESGVQFGVLQAQMIGQALTRIDPVRATLDRIGSQSLNMMASMMRTMDLSMAIEGSSEPVEPVSRVDGSDFTHQNFQVTFETVDPAENDRMLLVGEAMRRAGDISQLTFWKKYAKHVIENPEQEQTNLLVEGIMTFLAQTGQLAKLAISEDVARQMAEQAGEAVDQTKETIQNRQNETVPEGTRLAVQEMEAISGAPGALTAPREVAEQGFGAARPSQTGLPGR